MQTVLQSEARDQLDTLIALANRDREPIAITRNGENVAILISAEDFTSMEETMYLLSTPANAAKMRQGLMDYAAGRLQPGD